MDKENWVHMCKHMHMSMPMYVYVYVYNYLFVMYVVCCLNPRSAQRGQWVKSCGWLSYPELVRMWQQALFLILRECLLYPPPVSHWHQESVSSKWRFLVSCHCLCHQSLGFQAGFSLALMWKLPSQLQGPTGSLLTFMQKQPLPRQQGLSVPPTPIDFNICITAITKTN